MAEGFIGGLIEGFMSEVAPSYFQYIKQQEEKAYEEAQFHEQQKGLNAVYADAINNESDPRRKAIIEQQRKAANINSILMADYIPKALLNLQNFQLQAINPTTSQKNANYVFDNSLPEENREFVRQIELSERPYDNAMLEIRKKNAETLGLYRKAQSANVGNGSGKIGPNGFPLPKVKPGERYNPNTDKVEVLEGSDLERVQLEKHNEAASKVNTITNVADNMIATGNDLLNDEGFSNLFGKGDIVTGAAAYGKQFLSPGAMTKLEQFKNELKTQGGALYKEIANSPGSMQVAEWPILEGQLATIKPNMPEEDARNIIKQAINFVEKAKNRKKELYIEQYADSKYYNPDISGESKNILPLDLENMFTLRRGSYRYSPDNGMRKSMLDGKIHINKNGKWVDTDLMVNDKNQFSLIERVEDKKLENDNDDPYNIKDVLKIYSGK